MSYISTSDLSVVLGLPREGMPRWPPALKPVLVMPRMHRYADVNIWLAAPGRAKGFATPPTIEQILSGEINLIRRERATEMFSEVLDLQDAGSYVWRRIRNGRLESLLLRPQTWAVSVRSVERLIGESKATEDFTHDEIRKIFGIGRSSTSTLYRIAASGQLTITKDPDNANYLRVTRESALMLLKRLLSRAKSSMSAEDWINDRLNSSEPLLTVPEAAARLGLIHDDVRDLLRKGELFFIPSPEGNKRFISPDSVAFYQEQELPLTIQEQARVFGAATTVVQTWHRKGLLACPLHQHEDPRTLYRWCMVAYVHKRVKPGVDATRWVRHALRTNRVLWIENKALNKRIITHSQLVAAASEGRIPAVRSPAGMLVYVAGAVRKEVKRLG